MTDILAIDNIYTKLIPNEEMAMIKASPDNLDTNFAKYIGKYCSGQASIKA